ncbi:hypothetical protein BD311DRAFT_754757, partial [Dichomitus squalens]
MSPELAQARLQAAPSPWCSVHLLLASDAVDSLIRSGECLLVFHPNRALVSKFSLACVCEYVLFMFHSGRCLLLSHVCSYLGCSFV